MSSVNVRLLFKLITSILILIPATSSSCSREDLKTLKTILRASTSASDSLQSTPEPDSKRCPALKNITETLQVIVSGIHQIEQSGLGSDRVEQIRKTFQRKVDSAVTATDITSVQDQVGNLRAELVESTRKLYEDSVASVVKLLMVNQAFSVGSLSKRKLVSGPLDELGPEYKLYLSPLQYLNRTNSETLLGSVFDAIAGRLNKLDLEIEQRVDTGRNDLVTLLCWTINNELLREKYAAEKSEISRLALQFYPKFGDRKSYAADIERRKVCSERFPDTLIRGINLGDA